MSKNFKKSIKYQWDKFTDWFLEKDHPHSKLNRKLFFYDLVKVIILSLVFLIIHTNLDKVNQIVLIVIKLGSLIQLVLLFFIILKTIHIIKNLRYFFRGLSHGVKVIISIVLVVLVLVAFLNNGTVIDSLEKSYKKINFENWNPIIFPSNFSLGEISSLKMGSYNSIKDLQQNPSNYLEKNVRVKGKLNNRLGGYSLEDSDGYWVWIEDNCIEGQREYNYNSQIYTAIGMWLPPKESEYFTWGIEYKYRLRCTTPLS